MADNTDATTATTASTTATAATDDVSSVRVMRPLASFTAETPQGVAVGMLEERELNTDGVDDVFTASMPVLVLVTTPTSDDTGDDTAGVYALPEQFCATSDDTSDGTSFSAVFCAMDEESLRAGVGALIVDFAMQAMRQRSATGAEPEQFNYTLHLRSIDEEVGATDTHMALLPGDTVAVLYETDEQLRQLINACAEFAQRIELRLSAPTAEEVAQHVDAHVECDFLLALVPAETRH